MSNQGSPIDEFTHLLRRATERMLLLDYDGTLAPFRNDTRQAVPYPGIRELIDVAMTECKTRVVIVSGRWSRDLIPLLGFKRRPEIWGMHGRERMQPDGQYALYEIPDDVREALLRADLWEAAVIRLGGRVERKPGGLAFHWRGLLCGSSIPP